MTFSDGVVSIVATRSEELPEIQAMERDDDTDPYILAYSLDKHRHEFSREDIRYKSIYVSERIVGFVILVLDPDGRSVELARIVIAEKGASYGTRTMGLVEQVCTEELGRSRMWLDVFDYNARAQRVYRKCGYRLFGHKEHQGQRLELLEKELARIDRS